MMADQKLQGRLLWHELLTTDMKAAEKFYTAVVGWTVTPFPEAPDPYDMWTRAGGVPIGGVMKIPRVPGSESGRGHRSRAGSSATYMMWCRFQV